MTITLLQNYKFTAESVLKEFSKSLKLCKVTPKSWLPRAPWAPGHCPVERWRTRFIFDVWRAETIVTASRYDNYTSITLTPWSTSVKLVKCQTLAIRRFISRRIANGWHYTLHHVQWLNANCMPVLTVTTSFFLVNGCAYSRSFSAGFSVWSLWISFRQWKKWC